MSNHQPQRQAWISRIEVHTEDEEIVFDTGQPLGLSFHDDLVHVSVMRDGAGLNYFYPLDRVRHVFCREQGVSIVPRGADLIVPS